MAERHAMNEKTAISRFPGWFVAWAAFTIAALASGVGFYGPSIFLQTLHVTHGWSVAIISLAVTVHFLLSALIIAYLPEIQRSWGIALRTTIGALLSAGGFDLERT
jgi:hypothetical protein